MEKIMDIPEGTNIIDIRKRMNKILSEARDVAKSDKCILCWKPQTSFYNSHYAPQLSLKNIADNGMLFHASALTGMEVVDTEKGVNSSGTFHFICNICDGTFFKTMKMSKNCNLNQQIKR